MLLQDGAAYAYLINAVAPEVSGPASLNTKDPMERAKMVLEQAEKLDCKRYLTAKDIVEGSPNLNLAFVAQIFQHRQARIVEKCFCLNLQYEELFPLLFTCIIFILNMKSCFLYR